MKYVVVIERTHISREVVVLDAVDIQTAVLNADRRARGASSRAKFESRQTFDDDPKATTDKTVVSVREQG